ncbi:hypothetical protein SBRCBS47491_007879 [Sporothrix bragantina]|uniref:HMA domain-containing protein n=1 Tax=Sporothrix bragantina TaxID=671064 RepID=A0ABP0CI66_9PEZI
MACCYIAASMIAFILRSCDALDIGLGVQYNETVTHSYGNDDEDDDYAMLRADKKKAPTTKTTDNTTSTDSILSPVLVVAVSGMTCGACVGTVESAIREVKGVDDVQANLALQEARVFLKDTHKDTTSDELQKNIVQAIEDAGYGAVHVGCSAPPPAIRLAMLQHTDELATLKATLTGLGQYGTAVFAVGTGARLAGLDLATSHPVLDRLRASLLLVLTITAVWQHARWIVEAAWKAARAGRATMHTLIMASTTVGLSLGLAQLLFGSSASPSESQYHYDSILGVLLIVSLGRYMDLLSRRRATRSFAGLYALLDQTSVVELAPKENDEDAKPTLANKTKNRRIPSHLARPSDEIIVQPYKIIPCDSYVVAGTSHANEAIVTGESRPRPKTVGDRLLAGSRNGPGQLRAAVMESSDNNGGSFLAQLVRQVETALATKPAAQKRIDGITQYFVSGVLVVAIIAASVAANSASVDGNAAAARAAANKLMVVLAAACPCALGLAVPCAVMAGIDVAWQNGILMLQGAETMERAAATTHVVLDKTGTLTRGTPSVTDVSLHPDWQTVLDRNEEKQDTPAELAVLICAAEIDAMASHPLASAVFRHMLPLCGEATWRAFRSGGGQVKDVKTVPGRGVECDVIDHITEEDEEDDHEEEPRRVVVGSLTYLQELGVEGLKLPKDVTEDNKADDDDLNGSRVYVAVDGQWAATLTLRDSPKTDALKTLAALRKRGLKVSMLTGDSPGEAARIAKTLGIQVAGAAATPDTKLKHIQKLQLQGRSSSSPADKTSVMMVGDGINDAPSLAAADVGVMLAHGTRCLSAGGSVLILHAHQLGRLVTLLDLSRTTLVCVQANVIWAVGYNILAVSLAVGAGDALGFPYLKMTPPTAAAMMSFSSLSVTLSGLLLRNHLSRRYGQEE